MAVEAAPGACSRTRTGCAGAAGAAASRLEAAKSRWPGQAAAVPAARPAWAPSHRGPRPTLRRAAHASQPDSRPDASQLDGEAADDHVEARALDHDGASRRQFRGEGG